jgi:S1-C subfamily serine protease
MLSDELPDYKFNKTRSDGVKIFKKYSNSVVFIQNGDYFGSGSIIKESGLILTNWHVVQKAKVVKVFQKPGNFKKIDKSKALVADIIKINETMDLALLQLRNIPLNITPIKLGEIEDVIIASEVHAIGHPQGNNWSYTKGTISQVRSDYQWESSNVMHRADTIQTQTPISPGNSGGPLLDKNGKLIGVNSFIDASGQSQNINYAISISSIDIFLNSKQNYVEAKVKNNFSEKRISKTKTLVDLNNDGTYESIAIDHNGDGKPDEIKTHLDDDDKYDKFAEDLNYDGVIDRISTFVKMKDGNEILIIETDTNNDGEIDKLDNKFVDYDLDGKVDEVFPGNA